MSIQYNQIICDLSRPLEPLPTGQNEVIRKIAGIRAVFFDIYGTLDDNLTAISIRRMVSRQAQVRTRMAQTLWGNLLERYFVHCAMKHWMQLNVSQERLGCRPILAALILSHWGKS